LKGVAFTLMKGGAALRTSRRTRQSGSQVWEATLVIIPLLLMTFLMLDLSMVIFLRTTMHEAVREGDRYAITGQVRSGYTYQDDAIKAAAAEDLPRPAGWPHHLAGREQLEQDVTGCWHWSRSCAATSRFPTPRPRRSGDCWVWPRRRCAWKRWLAGRA
jgi:Flp pilus assembly protein TadG